MERMSLRELTTTQRDLIKRALNAAGSAYAPYSKFSVGCAIRTKDGDVFSSANVENSSYGVTLCAEVGAISAANNARALKKIQTIAIVGYGKTPKKRRSPITPCGRCRQLIAEAARVSRFDIEIFACSGNLKNIERYTISELLPAAFESSVFTH